jgi:hypothetical protein
MKLGDQGLPLVGGEPAGGEHALEGVWAAS